jgi:AcrR family transcriptional regulator
MTASQLPRPSARDELSALVRARIMMGVAELIEANAGDFTFRELAAASGVPERTVYRQYPSKERLLAEFWDWLNREHLKLPPPPKSVDELLAQIPLVFATFDRNEPLIRAMLRDAQGRMLRLAQAEGRRTELRAALRVALQGLPPSRQKKVLAGVRLLTSAAGWETLKDLGGLSGPEAAEAAQCSVRALLAQAQSTTPARGKTGRALTAKSRRE